MKMQIKTVQGFDDRNIFNLLAKHKDRLAKKFPIMFDWLKIKPPKQIVLRPFFREYAQSSGQLVWDPMKGFEVVINAEYCSHLPDKGIWVADHELAHIGTILKYNDWTHKQRFRDICKFVRGRNCRKCRYCF